MSDMKKLIAQVRDATSRMVKEVQDVDAQVAELHQQRAALNDGIVTREDYVEYLKESFRRQSRRGRNKLLAALSKPYQRQYATLERGMVQGEGITQDFLNLTLIPTDVTQVALYLWFGDALAERIGELLKCLDWPDDAVPVAERREMVKKLDIEIAALTDKRDALVRQIEEAGFTTEIDSRDR
ncbi:hypothetical protein WL51_06980 [Burkholderia ubonensis]|uniref:hypothetical protein n=1 Tax=Burkholderia ubonensis TaxID=101571 RepID=UPI000759C71F|nr:hypothetical protein [Burkholderia ubonensis]KWC40826.1 hypothetical protein WL51_06980 [Burkholderia ubonensis]